MARWGASMTVISGHVRDAGSRSSPSARDVAEHRGRGRQDGAARRGPSIPSVMLTALEVPATTTHPMATKSATPKADPPSSRVQSLKKGGWIASRL